MAEKTNAVITKNPITFADGIVKVFTSRTNEDGSITSNRLFTSSEVNENGFTSKVYLANGELKQFSINNDSQENLNFIFKLAARGAEELIKNAVTGITSFEPQVDETGKVVGKTVPEVIAEKISEFEKRELNSRITGLGTSEPLSIIERVYAHSENLNPDDPEQYQMIKSWSKSLDRKEKKSLVQPGGPLFGSWLEVDKILRQEREEALLEAHRKALEAAA